MSAIGNLLNGDLTERTAQNDFNTKRFTAGLVNSLSFGAAGKVSGSAGNIGVAVGTVIGLVVDPFVVAGKIGLAGKTIAEAVGDLRAAGYGNSAIRAELETDGLLLGKAAQSYEVAQAAARKAAATAKWVKKNMFPSSPFNSSTINPVFNGGFSKIARGGQPAAFSGGAGVEMTRGAAAGGGMTEAELETLLEHPTMQASNKSLVPLHIEQGHPDVPVHSTQLPNGDHVKTGDLTTREFKPTSSAVANKVIKVLNGGKNLQHVAVYVGKVARDRSGKLVPSDNGQHMVVEHWGPGGAKVTIRPVSTARHFEAKITPKQFGYSKVPAESDVARLAARDRALAVVGKGSYRASVENCQHVAGFILTGKAESPEAARIIKNVVTGAATAGMAGARLSLLKSVRNGKRKRKESVQPGPGPGPGPSPDPNIPDYGGDAFGFWEYSRRLHKWVFI
jgi:hypothetical protein